MTCLICKQGEVRPGTTTLTVERGSMTLVIEAIPARVCGSCDEAYFDAATTKRIEELARHQGLRPARQRPGKAPRGGAHGGRL